MEKDILKPQKTFYLFIHNVHIYTDRESHIELVIHAPVCTWKMYEWNNKSRPIDKLWWYNKCIFMHPKTSYLLSCL